MQNVSVGVQYAEICSAGAEDGAKALHPGDSTDPKALKARARHGESKGSTIGLTVSQKEHMNWIEQD